MSQQENNRYLRMMWLPLTVMLGVALAGLLFQLSKLEEDATETSSLPLAIAASILVGGGVWLWAKRGVVRAFRASEPTALINLLESNRALAMMPSGDAWRVYFRAWAFTLYGHFDSARQALEQIQWHRHPPMLRAAATSVEVLLCFFETREYAQGFNLARTAHAAAEVSTDFPGAKTSLEAHASLVEIGRVLTDQPRPDTVDKLADYARRLPLGARVIATWGLAAAYARAGDTERADRALATCRELAPHCAPLTLLPPH